MVYGSDAQKRKCKIRRERKGRVEKKATRKQMKGDETEACRPRRDGEMKDRDSAVTIRGDPERQQRNKEVVRRYSEIRHWKMEGGKMRQKGWVSTVVVKKHEKIGVK